MATTTATFSLASADIAPSPVSVSTSSTLYKAGLSIGLDQTTGMNKRILKTSDTAKTTLIPRTIGGTFAELVCAHASGTVVTHNANSAIVAGLSVYGEGIVPGTTIASITDTTHFVLSASADGGTLTGQTLTFSDENYTPNKANKVYICNASATKEDFIEITINSEIIGRLYGGDWMFMPWSATDGLADIHVTAAEQTTTAMVNWMVIGEGDAA